MEIKEYGLVQESDNVYSGLLKTKYEDMTQTWDVRVIWDHSTDKYTVTWDIDEQDLEPLTCPFCGYEVENEEDELEEVWSNDSEDEDWN